MEVYIEALRQLADVSAQLAYLRGLGDAKDLGQRLLAAAEASVSHKPDDARLFAELCVAHGDAASVPAALYLLAQMNAMQAQFEPALALIDHAQREFAAQGRAAEALRTEVGRISVLAELGRYDEAIAVAQTALQQGQARSLDAEIMARLQLNLGMCYVENGQPDLALQALAQAEAEFMAVDSQYGAGGVSNNQGVLLLTLGRTREALRAFDAAAKHFDVSGDVLESAQALLNAGYTRCSLGAFSAGLADMQRAGKLLHALDASADKYVALLDQAEAYSNLNLYPEALSAYREASERLAQAGMAREQARALWGMGAVLAAQSFFSQAEATLEQAAQQFRASDNLPALISVLLEQGALLQAQGRYDLAETQVQRALDLAQTQQLPLHLAQAHLRMAGLALASAPASAPASQAQASQAQASLLACQPLIDQLALPRLQQEWQARMGHACLVLGQPEDARRWLSAAVQQIEQQRRSLTNTRLRIGFLQDKTQAYDDLIRLYAQSNDAERAFDLSERAKSRTLIDEISQRRHDPATQGLQGDDADWVELRGLSAQLNDCYNRLFNADGADTQAMADAQAQAVALEQKVSRLQMQLATQDNHAAAFGAPQPWAALKRHWPDNVCLLSYYIVEDEIFAFVAVPNDAAPVKMVPVGSVAVVQKLLLRLARQWERFEQGAAFVQRHLPQLTRSVQSVLGELYDALLRPLQPYLPETHADGDGQIAPPQVVVVPHLFLHQVPFHALHDGAAYWLEHYEISYAPSASVMALCQQRGWANAGLAYVYGVADAHIPEVLVEAQAVAEALPQARLRMQTQATVQSFLTEMVTPRYVHAACHGQFRADNPMFSAVRLDDAWLTAADIAQMQLDGACVTLSACESGRTGVLGGDEVLGLPRAFLSAGAATVMVSLWLVHDAGAAQLMRRYYAGLQAGQTPATALRAAQLALMAQMPHPYYWAPFVVLGRR